MEEVGFYDLLDWSIADSLNVSVDEYISVIESISKHRAYIIINAVLSGNEDNINRAKRIFNKLKTV